MKNFVQSGQVMPYTPGADVESGRFRQVGTLIGVATGKILNGEEGELALVGVYRVPNPDGVSLSQGGNVEYDETNHKVAAAAAGDYDIGTAFKASSGTDDVHVILPLGPGLGNGM